MANYTSASARPPDTPLSADVDLDVAWKRTVSRCQGITNWDLTENTELTVEDVVAKIKPPKRDSTSEIHEQAKKVFKRTLQCIQTFGAIVAPAASVVFGPSQNCFNAVNFVIVAAQSYTEAMENIAILMERVSAFLDRLRIYLEDTSAEVKLDRRLRKPYYDVLDHFLVVMGHVHKITSGLKGKVKLSFKLSLFREDGNIKDSLASLETLVWRVTQVEITTIVKDLSLAAKGIRGVDKKLDSIAETLEKTAASTHHLQAAEDRRSEADKERKEIELLQKALGIDPKREPWEERHGELKRDRIDGSGQWLLDFRFPSYSRWSDPKETCHNSISVRGEQGFGKSYLSSLVVDDLLEKHRSNPRVCVAYYYFNDREQSDTRDVSRESINKALKSIIWQLTQANRDASREYRKLVAKACENNTDLSKTEPLWDLLITAHEQSVNAMFYIILDGLNEPETEPGHPLSRVLSRINVLAHQQPLLRTRIFVTGRSAGMIDLTNEMEQKSPEINLAPPEKPDEEALNHSDILLYAERRLDKISFYRGNLESERELKDRIKTTLARGVRGDFFTLGSKLDEIAKARDEDKVDEILRRADEDRAQVVERQIRQLNETLTADEIEEVNEILIWAIGAFSPPTIQLLEDAFRLKDRKNKLLGPLKDRIRDRYADLFYIDDYEASSSPIYVDIRSDEIEKVLSGATEPTLPVEKISDRWSGKGDFQEAEVTLIERIIKTHMRHVFGDEGQDLFEKYNFKKFFDSKRAPSAARIQYHKEHTDIAAARSCLIALCDYYDSPVFSSLHDYGFRFFATHLKVQVNDFGVENVDTLAQYDIGRKLVRLLREQTFIDIYMDLWLLQAEHWVYDNELVDALHAWLTHGGTQRALQDMPQEKKWVSSLAIEGTSHAMVLESIAISAARLWLISDGFESSQRTLAFDFIFGYCNQLQGRHIPMEQYGSVEDIEKTVAWAKVQISDTLMAYMLTKKQLPNEFKDDQWEFSLGITLQSRQHVNAALHKYRSAAALNPESWRTRQQISIALAMKGKLSESLQTMNDLMAKEKWRLESDDDYFYQYWNNILSTVVSLNVDLKNNTAAEEASTKLVNYILDGVFFEEKSHRSVRLMMLIYTRQRKYTELAQLIERLIAKTECEEENWFIQLIYGFESHDSFHGTMLEVGHNSESTTTLLDQYQLAIDGASSIVSDDLKISLPLRLRSEQAKLRWFLGTSEDHDRAIATWEEILHAVPDEEDPNFTDIIWTRRMAATLLGNALVTKPLGNDRDLDEETAEDSLKRLERLQEIDHATGFQPDSDVRLPLARLLYLMKQTERARHVLRDYVGMAVRLLEESSGNNIAAAHRLGYVFMVLEDDINALAAVSLFSPEPDSETPVDNPTSANAAEGSTETSRVELNGPEATPNGSPAPVQATNSAKGLESGLSSSPATTPTVGVKAAEREDLEMVASPSELDVTSVDGQAQAGATSEHNEPHPPGTSAEDASQSNNVATEAPTVNGINHTETASGLIAEESEGTKTSSSPTSKPSLPTLARLDTSVSSKTSPQESSETPVALKESKAEACDSTLCEYEADYPTNMYACRDCLLVICAPCYQRLRDGTREHVNCHKTHSHLHIPPTDEQKLKDKPRNIVWVDGKDVPLQEWLDGIKSDWGLEERSVKARERWREAMRRVLILKAAVEPERRDSSSSD